MKIKTPSKKVCEEFHLTSELKGAQKGVDVLTKYYGIRRMKIVVDGRKVSRGYECDYFEGIATFTKKALNKRNVLHELYHHIVEAYELEMSERTEERMAKRYVRQVLKKART